MSEHTSAASDSLRTCPVLATCASLALGPIPHYQVNGCIAEPFGGCESPAVRPRAHLGGPRFITVCLTRSMDLAIPQRDRLDTTLRNVFKE
jgi:hypothetical protein